MAMSHSTPKHALADYTVGWICALPSELTAALHMLDVEHNDALSFPGSDTNSYSRGRMMGHNVVLACLTGAGTNQAAVVATHMRNTFPNIKFGLMVGIAGGAPSDDNDIRLGDIVVSLPTYYHGGVIQMDFGMKVEGGFHRSGTLNKPPPQLVKAVQTIRAQHRRHDPKYFDYISPSDLQERSPRMVRSFIYQGKENDKLFEASYQHPDDKVKNCKKCDQSRVIDREERSDSYPVVHYGNISSANHVMQDSETRDRIAAELQILAFEMEAAGLMDDFPCLVIRGICDYADSHINKRWQDYAALVAAAYGKELLSYISPAEAREMESIKPIQSKNKHYLMSRNSNNLFTGRRKVLQRINAAICGATDINQPTQRRFVIYGMGGAGKSEVCIKFAEENREQFWGIFWIDAVDTSSARRSFANITRECGRGDEGFDGVKQWLANCEFEWLLIIDNADDIDFDYSEYFPSGNRGRILLTSRNRECAELHTVGYEYFEKLDEEDAFELLSKAAGIQQSMTDERSKAVSAVIEVLGYHALALLQAGSFIKKQLCSIEEYPAQYKKQRETLLRFHPRQAGSTYGDVYATFEVSAQVLQDSSKQEDSDALELLGTLGFFNMQDVQELMFERAWSYAKDLYNGYDNNYEERSQKSSLYDPPAQDIGMLTDWHVSRLPHFLGDITSDLVNMTRFRQAKNTLASFSLIRVDQNSSSISMHPLAHSWCKDRLQTAEQNGYLCVAASTLALSTGRRFGYYDEFYRNLQIHMETCLNVEARKTLRRNDNYSSCQIFFRVALVLVQMNRHAEAREMINQTCDALAFDFNAVSRRTRSSHMYCQHLAAICEISAGNYQVAIQIVEALYEHTDHNAMDLTTAIEHSLALAYRQAGEHSKAVGLLESLVAVGVETLNGRYPERLASQHALAVAYLAADRNEEAVRLLQKVAVQNETLDEGHPDRLTSEHTLAVAYLQNKQPHKAVELLENVVAIEAKALSAQNSDRLASEHFLARAYLDIKQPHRAVELLENVVAVEAKALSAQNSDRLTSELLLARVYLDIKQPHRAVELLEKVVAIRAEILDAQDQRRLASEHFLARVYLDIKQPHRAVELLEKVVAILAEILDAQDQRRLSSEHVLAKAYLKVGRPGEAVTLLEHVVHTEEQTLHEADPMRITSQKLLADAYMALDPPETEKAERLWDIVAVNETSSSYESSDAGSDDSGDSGPMSEVGLEEQDYTHNGGLDSQKGLNSRRGSTGYNADNVDQELTDLEVPQNPEEPPPTNGENTEDQGQNKEYVLETEVTHLEAGELNRRESTGPRRRKRDVFKFFTKGKR